jgi:hypothetical protein
MDYNSVANFWDCVSRLTRGLKDVLTVCIVGEGASLAISRMKVKILPHQKRTAAPHVLLRISPHDDPVGYRYALSVL